MKPVLALVLGRECLAIKISDSIFGIGTEHNPANLVLVAVDREGEQLGAFMVAAEVTLDGPLLEVG